MNKDNKDNKNNHENKKKSKSNYFWPVTVATISLVTLSGTIYLLTRPCVIGDCPLLKEAEQLAEFSRQIFEHENESQAEIIAAQQQLNSSIEILDSIGTWSKYRPEAKKLLETYGVRQLSLDLLLQSLEKATKATNLSENPPLKPEQWQKIVGLWREAIALLQQLPDNNRWSAWIKEKITIYENNLIESERFLQQEQKAERILIGAREKARIAQARQGVAQSAANWKSVQFIWEAAIKQLEEIPPNTTAQEQVKELKPIWTSNLAAAREWKNQEEIAISAYEKAIFWAEQAKNAAAQNQWQEAVENWRNALNSLVQIPESSIQYNRTQSLRENYGQALQLAQAQLQIYLKQEQAKLSLEELCTRETKICEYKLEDNKMKVFLSSSYMRKIWQLEVQARVDGNEDIQQKLRAHISSIEDALQQISLITEINIEVYSHDGSLMAIYPQQEVL